MRVILTMFLLATSVGALALTTTGPAHGSTVLGTGIPALLGGDLTDPEDDGDQLGSNYNAIFSASVNEGFNRNQSFNIFDNSFGRDDKLCCGAAPLDVTAQFASQHTLTHFTLGSSNDSAGRDPDVWQIQGSNDGATWTEIFGFDNDNLLATGSRTDGTSSPFAARNEVIRWDGAGADFATPAAYSYFRLNVDSASGWVGAGGNVAVGELELFGTEVPEPSTVVLLGMTLVSGLGFARRRRS